MVWKISKSRVILTFLNSFLGFGFWVFETVIFMKYLFGAAEQNRTFSQVAIFLICSVIAWMLSQLFTSWYRQRYVPINDQLLYKELNGTLFEKVANVDISCYDDTDFYNKYTRASGEIFPRAVSVVNSFADVMASFLSSAFVIYTLFTINLWIGLFSAVPTFINLYFSSLAGKAEYKRNMEQTPYVRRQDYVNRAFYLQKFAKEVRLTNIFNNLHEVYNESTEGIVGVAKKYWKKIYALLLTKHIVCFELFFNGSWLLGAYMAMVRHTINVSDFVVVANGAVSGTWMLFSLADAFTTTYQNALYIQNLKVFMNYKAKIQENQPGLAVPAQVKTLELQNVSFRYKEDSEYVLKNINMKLEEGRLVSFVGYNGSGKTTLVKLIMRLYDPTEGRILLNGICIKEYDLPSYRQLIGTVFQDHQIFSMSVKENVILENEISGQEDEAVKKALNDSDVAEKINSLPNTIHSVLTREFDKEGIVLSGGEFQKIAIARAFAKKSSILLLDEPSAALDPLAEYRLYQNYIRLCKKENGKKKISVLISHRLSSAVMSDYIYLLDHGSIVEEGTHRTLMEKEGLYYQMFVKQAENYLMEITEPT
jgi:ATP-binding cassette subfamily B protein